MDVHSNDMAPTAANPSLSPRERECLQWVCWGKSSADIGTILGLSPRTVDSYLEKSCAKLRVRTRIEAVALAVRRGLIEAEAPGRDLGGRDLEIAQPERRGRKDRASR